MGGSEAGAASRPPLPEGLLDELGLRRGVDPPEGTFARLLLRPGHLEEVAVQGQVVTDGVLETQRVGLLQFCQPLWTRTHPEPTCQPLSAVR